MSNNRDCRVRPMRGLLPVAMVLALAAWTAMPASAQSVTYNVTVDTSSQAGNPGFIDFQFNGPAGTVSTAVVTNFSPNIVTGPPSISGDITGALPGSVTFVSDTPLQDYFQAVTFGNQVTFTVTVSGQALTSPPGSAGTSFFISFYDAALTTQLFSNQVTSGVAGEIDINGLTGAVTATSFPDQNAPPDVIDASLHSNVSFMLVPPALDGAYQVRYATNLISSTSSVINIINDGANGNVNPLGPGFGSANAGNICVNIYAIDPGEEMLACCSCLLTPDEVASLSVNAMLGNLATPEQPNSLTIKLLGSNPGGALAASSCSGSAATVGSAAAVNPLVGGFLAFGTTAHAAPSGGLAITESQFLPASLSPSELASLTSRCAAIQGNYSNNGICTGCQPGALGATKK